MRLRRRPVCAPDCTSVTLEMVGSAPVLAVYVDRERRGGDERSAVSVCCRVWARESGLRSRDERAGLRGLGEY